MAGQPSQATRAVRRDCINAFEGLLKKVDSELPYVEIGMEGLYYTKRNKFNDSTEKEKRSAGDRGTKLVLMFGSGRDVTSYSFKLKNLEAKSRTRSLRFDSVEAATTSMDQTVKQEGMAGKMMRSTALAANSMSFGQMLEGVGAGGAAAVSWLEDGLVRGTAEHAAAERLLDQGDRDLWGRVLNTAVAGDDPVEAMTAWSVLAYQLEGHYKPGVPPLDPGDPQLARIAGMSMGLDALYDGLAKLNDKIGADEKYVPDMNEIMDPETPEGRRALRGLMCLAMYKEAKDRGGKDVHDNDKRPVIHIDAEHASVYDRMTFARADAEKLDRSYAELDQMRRGIARASSVQSTFAGIAPEDGRAPSPDIRKYDQYRFYRCAMLGERPDMPSKAPDLKLSVRHGAALKGLSTENIMVQCPELQGKGIPQMSLKDFLEGAKDNNPALCGVTDRLPAMAGAIKRRGGIDDLEKYATDILSRTGGQIDGMVLEMSAFMDKKPFERYMSEPGGDGRSGYDIEDEFRANYVKEYGPAPQLRREINRAVGAPDFSKGILGVGSMWLSDIKANTPNLENLPTKESVGGGGRAAALAALSFRKRDAEMNAVMTTAMECSDGSEPASMLDALSRMPDGFAAGEFVRQLGKYSDIQARGGADLERGSMMLNDFLVLSGTYNINTPKGLRQLEKDIGMAYGPDAGDGKMLYRPADRAEKNALSALYENSCGYPEKAVVQLRSQGTEIGFLSAAWGAGDGPGMGGALAELKSAALDHDTFMDRKYAHMAEMLAGPRRSEDAMHMLAKDAERHQADGSEQQDTVQKN